MDSLVTAALLLATGFALWLLLQPAAERAAHCAATWRVHRLLVRALPRSHYALYRDVTLPVVPDRPAPGGSIDHVIVSPYAVFAVVTLRHSGWIAGSEREAHWTRTRFHSSCRFPNPLLGARAHAAALREFLGLEPAAVQSLVVFAGEARFRSAMPANVTQAGGLVPFVQVRTQQRLGFDGMKRVVGLIESSRPEPGAGAVAAQLAALRRTHGPRFGARQALLGLGLMTVLLGAAGSLVQRVAEMPGRFPSREPDAVQSPFAEDAAAPRIELPGTVRFQTAPEARDAAPAAGEVTAAVMPDRLRFEAGRRQEALDARLAWEASLLCAYSAESRRCACYEPQGRRADMDYASCRALADRVGRGTGD